jgi:hypothetical protein
MDSYKKTNNFYYNMLMKLILLDPQILSNNYKTLLNLMNNFLYNFVIKWFGDLYIKKIDIQELINIYSDVTYFKFILYKDIEYEKLMIKDELKNVDDFIYYFFSNNDYKKILEQDLINKSIDVYRFIDILGKLLIKEFENVFETSFDVKICRTYFKIFKYCDHIDYNSEYVMSYILNK